MSNWLDNSNNANTLKQSYIQGNLEVRNPSNGGGYLRTRNSTDALLAVGDSSFNGKVYLATPFNTNTIYPQPHSNADIFWNFAQNITTSTIGGDSGIEGTFRIYNDTVKTVTLTESEGFQALRSEQLRASVKNYVFPSDSFTIELYCKIASTSTGNYIISYTAENTAAGQVLWQRVDANEVKMYLQTVSGSGANIKVSDNNLNFQLDTWVHIVFVCDMGNANGPTLSVYQDGVFIKSNYTTSDVWSREISGYERELGVNLNNFYRSHDMESNIKRFQVIDGLLDATEVETLYNNREPTVNIEQIPVKVGTSVSNTNLALDVSGVVDISGGMFKVDGNTTVSKNLIISDLSYGGNFNYTTISTTTQLPSRNIMYDAPLEVTDGGINVNYGFVAPKNYNQNIIAADLASNGTFGSDVSINQALKVPGNVLIVDSKNSEYNYGAYTIHTKDDYSDYFAVGKSASNVFNILNKNKLGVYMNSGSNSFSSKSDERLKKNIVPLENECVEKLQKLNPVSYQWKTQTDDKLHYGFIAQEVEEILPELVSENENKDGSKHKGVAMDDLIPYLVKYYQYLSKKLEMIKQNKSDSVSVSTNGGTVTPNSSMDELK